MTAHLVPARELAASDAVSAEAPLLLVDLDDGIPDEPARPMPGAVLVGVSRRAIRSGASGALSSFVQALDCTLVLDGDHPETVTVTDMDSAIGALTDSIAAAPIAAATLTGLLRLTERSPIADGLLAESLAYSMLLAGPEFARWRAARQTRPEQVSEQPVLITRTGAVLEITLNRPQRRNAFSRDIREGLLEALDLVRRDQTITEVNLRGAGPAFCSGGDLDEFGTAPDVATAHLIRSRRSVATALADVGDRVRAHLHGACIGAGIELPSFAGSVRASRDTTIVLPELSFGLVPGAGGTVGITRRIGRWRCAYLALTGQPIDAATALAWGLVDEIDDGGDGFHDAGGDGTLGATGWITSGRRIGGRHD